MRTILKIIYESIAQAFQQLSGNKLRSFLSLLGITIGIFCIISVKSAVDSLEANIIGSMNKLGSDVVYVKKFSWEEPPHDDFLKFMRRPNPSYEDFRVLKKKSRFASVVAYYVVVGFKTLKYKSNSVENSILIGHTYDFLQIFDLEIERGRYFSNAEYQNGSNKTIIGYKVAEELFGSLDPLGKKINLMGRKMEVIGVIKKAGEDLINPLDFDDCILVSYKVAGTLANLKSKYIFDSTVNVKAAEDVSMEQLKDEMTGILRAQHRLSPKQEDDFSLNQLTMITSLLGQFFSILNLAGMFIGFFAILVGMFSVANIMFVSVKERTNIIGVKKALGAKNYMIILEFLIESIILCLIGGVFGLIVILTLFPLISYAAGIEFSLSVLNVVLGLSISIVIGVLSGLIPAIIAAKMDPVEAMRSK